jgi:hypothetical protein
MAHRILVRTFLIDVPSDVHDRTLDFWATALGATIRSTRAPEYHFLDDASPSNRIVVQDIGAGPARIHFDIHTDDLDAEVKRLLDCGATQVARHDHWIVMQDPAGLPFCVVWALGEYRPVAEREDFERRAKTIG